MKIYQLSKSKGNLYWTGTVEMTPERWATHSRECEGYIYTPVKPDEKYIAKTGEYTGIR